MDDEIIIDVENPNYNSKKTKAKKETKKQKNKKKAEKKSANKKKTSFAKNAEKKEKRKMKTSKKFLLICILLFITLIGISQTPLFQIKEIEVIGNNVLSKNEIISISEIQNYTNIFRINKFKINENLFQNSYIEELEIGRKLPNTVTITIKERTPYYLLQFAGSYIYVDKQGYLLEISKEKLNLPILTGVKTDLNNIKMGERLELTDLKKLNTVISIFEAAEKKDLFKLINKVDISNDDNFTLFLESEGKTVYWGDGTELNSKINYLEKILEKEKGVNGEIFLNEDLSSQGKVFREKI